MKNNYILIDFENVQPSALSLLEGYDFKVMLFVGANQNKVSFELASTLQGLGSSVKYIKICGNGPNALDFHIAYYIGKIAEQDPDAYFHIISKDSGFDPLIKHLKESKILVRREKDISEIPLLRISIESSLDEKISTIVKRLSAMGKNRPRKLQTLKNTINAWFTNKLAETELLALIDRMLQLKIIENKDQKISYKLSDVQPQQNVRTG